MRAAGGEPTGARLAIFRSEKNIIDRRNRRRRLLKKARMPPRSAAAMMRTRAFHEALITPPRERTRQDARR